jgi:hypothetical protein
MKHCPRCNQDKDEAEFGKNRTRPDGLQVQCRACIKLIHRDWYERNKERHYGNVQKRRKQFSDEVIRRLLAYLKAHPCVDCGMANPHVLHLEPVHSEATFSLSARLLDGATWTALLPEIEKCEVRCANCRRLRTAQQLGPRRALLKSLGLNEDDPDTAPSPTE